MLKKRIAPILLLLDGRLVKTMAFDGWRDVGDPVKSAAVYSSQLSDELIFLNIDREARSIAPLVNVLDRVAVECFMPLVVGGGITTFEDAQILFRHGADKVVINSAAYGSPDLLRRIADRYGTQAVVVGIDTRYSPDDGRYRLYGNCGRTPHASSLVDHVGGSIEAGAGEILIQSIDRDGTMKGFDVDLIQAVMSASTVPVIGCGGAGNYEHLQDAFLKTDVSALACGSLFNFTDSNPLRAKAFLANHGLQFKRV